MRQTSNNNSGKRLASGLGWFSLGLGLAEVLTPGALARLIGVNNDSATRKLIRAYGLRELAAGIGIFAQPEPEGWIWARVAGDALDLASLGSALASRQSERTRVAGAVAAVAAVTALDVLCLQQLNEPAGSAREKTTKVSKSIIVGCGAEQAYAFWRNFENLPTFMTYLDSVRNLGGGRTRWVAVGPAGKKIQWDAETVADEPNRRIAWRSADGSMFANAGQVTFEKAPGDRGTLVHVEMDYAPSGGTVGSALGKVFGTDLGQRIAHDLRNFKQVIEIGEVTQSDASIHEGMHAAQPAMSHQ